MPLPEQFVQLPIDGGLAQKLDPRLLPPGKVAGLVNGTFDKVGSVTKRPGNSALPGQFQAGGNVPASQAMVSYNGELLTIDYTGRQLASYASGSQEWVGTFRSVPECTVTRSGLAQGNQNTSCSSMVIVNGFKVVTWLTNASYVNARPATDGTSSAFTGAVGQAMVMVLDLVSNTVVVQPTLLSAGDTQAACVKAIAAASDVVVTWVSPGLYLNDPPNIAITTLNSVVISCTAGSTPAIGPTNTSATSQFIASPYAYDLATDGLGVWVTYSYIKGGQPNIITDILSPIFGTTVILSTSPSLWATSSVGVYSIGSDVIANGTTGSYNLMAAWSYYNTGSKETHVDASVLQAKPTTGFTAVSVPTVITSTVLPPEASTWTIPVVVGGLVGGAPSAGTSVAWRDRSNAGISWSLQRITPYAGDNPSVDFKNARAYTVEAGAVLGTYTGTGISLGPYRKNFYVDTISKLFWVNPTMDATSSLAKCYQVGILDQEGSRNTKGSLFYNTIGFNTAYVFDLDLDSAGSGVNLRRWRPVATALPRQISDATPFTPFQPVGMLSSVTPTDDTGLEWVTTVPATQAADGVDRSSFQQLLMSFKPFQAFESTEANADLHIAAGVPYVYDGIKTGEISFAYYPHVGPDYVLAQTGSSWSVARGAAMDPGLYGYQVVYEYTDANGNVAQSAPSILRTVTIPSPGIGSAGFVELYIPNMCVTDRNHVPLSGSQAFPQAVIYRTTANGSVPYRLTSGTSAPGLICYPYSSSLFYTDYVNDNNIDGLGGALNEQPIIYTEGGVLPYFNPPSAKYCCSHVQRVWLAGTDDPKAIWFSAQIQQSQAISFDDAFQFTVDDGGDITGIVGMDDKLVIFKADRVFYVTGLGPNGEGQNNDLSAPIRIQSDVGCVNHKSIVSVPQGIMFQSSVGIYLLDRSLGVSYVGSPVTDLLQQFPFITSAVIHPTMSQVRFTCGASALPDSGFTQGAVLVYDYLVDRWTTFFLLDNAAMGQLTSQPASYFLTGTMPSAACVYKGAYHWASTLGSFSSVGGLGSLFSSSSFYRENTLLDGVNAYTDAGAWVPLQVTSGWLATSDVQGFQRTKRVHVLGQAWTSCDVNVSYSINYRIEQDGYQLFQASTEESFRRRVHVADQKNEAIQVTVWDTLDPNGDGTNPPGNVYLDPSSGSTGEGMQLTRLGILCGTKKSPMKLPPNKSA